MKIINNYEDVIKEKRSLNDVVAILCAQDTIKYVCFKMGNKESIESYIGESNGKAIAFTNNNQKYWCLIGNKTYSFLLFRQDNIKGYTDISNSDDDLVFAEYLYSMI